jgi:integrase
MSVDSIDRPSAGKLPARYRKPSKKFPLRIHRGTGYWCKKIDGKVHYFGRVADDPDGVEAMEKWKKIQDGADLQAPDATTLREVCNAFLTHKRSLVDNGELTWRTWRGLHDTCQTVIAAFGKERPVSKLTPDDFAKLRTKLAQKRQAVALRNEVYRVRSIFKFALEQGKIAVPVRYGQSFEAPKAKKIRQDRNAHKTKHGLRMFQAVEIRAILETSGPAVKAMVLLAANCGFGQSDLASLPLTALDLDGGWVDFARVKTAIERRIPLWPETVAAIRNWIPQCPKAKNPADEGLLFLTKHGARWVKTSVPKPDSEKPKPGGAPNDAIGSEFNKVLDKLGLKKPGIGFYALRHTVETIGGESKDQVAVDAIMGHTDSSMAAHYRETIFEDRLKAVVNVIRAWLWAKPAETPDAIRLFAVG